MPHEEEMLVLFAELARQAGAAILDVRAEGFVTDTKGDESPVTRADRKAEEIILAGLRSRFPGIPVVAEEEASAGLSPQAAGERFILVDPLDGTREFISGGTDFTVNIALIEDGQPVAGVVYVPAAADGTGTMYTGGPDGATCNGQAISAKTRAGGSDGPVPSRVVASKSHRTEETDVWIQALARRDGLTCDIVSIGSSLKFCLLAEGAADYYPRFGRTMEWDTAAGDAVLRAAGGMTFHLDDRPFVYGKGARWEGGDDVAFANPHFIACADARPPEV